MNKKFSNFLKKPLLVLSSVLLVVGLVVVITINCVSVCKLGKYTTTSKSTVLGQEVTTTSTYKFKGDKVVVTVKTNDATTSNEMQYEIKDGELYLVGDLLNTKTKVGKINAFKITSLVTDNNDVKVVNKSAVAINVIAIIVLVVGACGIVTSVVYTKLSEKNKKSK